MQIEYIPLLRVQREIYEVPRGWDRFRQYLSVMQPGTDDQLVPLFVMNPMAREHVTARLEELLALDVDGVAEAAVVEAAQRFPDIAARYKASLVLADDVQGGWTNRYLSEAQIRFGYTLTPQRRTKARELQDNGWSIGLLWAGEEPDRRRAEQTIRAALYRSLYIRQRGFPTTLREMIVQESLALVFGGAQPAMLDQDEMAYSRDVIRPHLETTEFPVAFACLYGDSASSSVGYPTLGLSADAGYVVGYYSVLDYLQRSGQSAEAALATGAAPIDL